MAHDEAIALIASPGAPVGSNTTGAVFVFEREGDNWIEKRVIPNGRGLGGGSLIALVGNRAAIAGGQPSDVVFWTRLETGEWKLFGTGVSTAATRAMSMSEDWFVSGHPEFRLNGVREGAVRIFRKNDFDSWTSIQILFASDLASDDFGSAVAVDGDTLLVGTPRRDQRRGAVYAHRVQDGRFEDVQIIESPDPNRDGQFGHRIALDADAATCAVLQLEGSQSGPIIYFYEESDLRLWELTASVPATSLGSLSSLGTYFDFDGGLFAYGVSRNLPGFNRVFLYRRDSRESWSLVTTIRPDGSGARFSLSRGTVLIGRGRSIETLEVEYASLVCNTPPLCPVTPNPRIFFDPNHKFVSIDLVTELAITDPDGDEVTIEITSITQDEPVNALGDGNTDCDAEGLGDDIAHIRAERSAHGDGRVYAIHYVARDDKGAECDGVLEVHVPKDPESDAQVIDSGQRFESTICAAAGDVNADSAVDFADLTSVLHDWGMVYSRASGNSLRADVDANGVVGFGDVIGVLSEWGSR